MRALRHNCALAATTVPVKFIELNPVDAKVSEAGGAAYDPVTDNGIVAAVGERRAPLPVTVPAFCVRTKSNVSPLVVPVHAPAVVIVGVDAVSLLDEQAPRPRNTTRKYRMD